MTALDNMGEGSTQGSGKSSRLSLRQGRKRALNSDISPAPEPRTSHRFRTSSSSDTDDRNKTPPMLRKMSLGRNATNSSSRRTSGGSSQASGSLGASTGELGNGGGRVTGVCPLANLGNTCFLNSVLYALRFLPGFTHDLHHLHMHLQAAGNQSDANLDQRIQFLSELHRVFVSLGQEERGLSESKRIPAFQPYDFLEALRVVNPMFEGNRQQDAHELLHCLLDQLCHLPQDLRQGKPNGVLGPEASKMEQEEEPGFPEPKRLRRRSERIQAIEEDSSKILCSSPQAVDVVGSKFVGRMCLETCCSECEQVTGREENFLEVCVPVKTKADFDEDENVSEPQVFMSALCEEECLRDNNKYWCDHCFHHNEARRSVHYSQLPHHLVIHVKRFSSYHRNMFTAKCSEAMPAPLELSCFCRGCLTEQIKKQALMELARDDKGSKPSSSSKLSSGHLPYHLTAVVCHLGATLSSGHYLSFVRLSALDSSRCPEQQVAPPSQPVFSQPVSSTKVECQWIKCCGLQLDHIRPLSGLNGHMDIEEDGKASERESLWLECDDEKIKLVSAAEVSDMMRTTIITPYLLFYSRL
ncbi:ubiquitin carboxyl-terminal hydrolase 1-like isoform X1 [Penaeus chinensis]|uniref:ubiquitin carboxyl-terminal hydrolase 1-like isoform X1 n=1 Tax=Penaeus chinensis TaxID=139456 RepID=UPI001FB5A05A|nr:ubiquitin carboxyl-terminal hydrolase 1-like isoform X1 [Penaeus chinensis]